MQRKGFISVGDDCQARLNGKHDTFFHRLPHGFTLIELLVVVSIIALLVSILMPALGRARNHAKVVVCRTRLKNHAMSSFVYAESFEDAIPVSFWQSDGELPTQDFAWRSYVMKEVSGTYGRDNLTDYGSELFGLGLLWDQGFYDMPEINVCTTTPAEVEQQVIQKIENFENEKRVDAEYSYIPLRKSPVRLSDGTIDYWPHATKVQHLSGHAVFYMDKIRSWDAFSHFSGSNNSGTPLVNIAFGDGHVVISDNKEFYTPERVKELSQVTGYDTYITIDNTMLFEFLDTVEP